MFKKFRNFIFLHFFPKMFVLWKTFEVFQNSFTFFKKCPQFRVFYQKCVFNFFIVLKSIHFKINHVLEFKKGYIQKTNAFWNFKKSSDVMLRIDIVFKVQRGLVVSRVHPLEWLAMRPLLTCHFLYFDQFVLECNTLLGRPTRTHPLCGHPPIWCKEVSNYLTAISSGDSTEATFRTWERIKWCVQLPPHVVHWVHA